jgi:diguanylate cyclase (GGDEF)-like protein
MAQLLRQLEQQSMKVRALSQTDELTGLPNRRAWTAELPRAIEQARRNGVPLSVSMLDLDRFKLFNDAYGHPAGDRLLKAAAAAWQERLRAVDYLARYGGEEFLVLLPDADSERGRQVVDRLRDATPLGQTFSAGVATWDGVETSDEMVARADTALYAAKQAGRNRILLATTERAADIHAG